MRLGAKFFSWLILLMTFLEHDFRFFLRRPCLHPLRAPFPLSATTPLSWGWGDRLVDHGPFFSLRLCPLVLGLFPFFLGFFAPPGFSGGISLSFGHRLGHCCMSGGPLPSTGSLPIEGVFVCSLADCLSLIRGAISLRLLRQPMCSIVLTGEPPRGPADADSPSVQCFSFGHGFRRFRRGALHESCATRSSTTRRFPLPPDSVHPHTASIRDGTWRPPAGFPDASSLPWLTPPRRWIYFLNDLCFW